MRPTLPTTVLAALLAALLLCPATAAFAEDVPAPRPKRAAQPSATDDARTAVEIGRALLSTKDAVRRKAVDRLLARIRLGGDLGAFLSAMNKATRDWADRHERLLEVWVRDAVHGSAAERARAVRLLTALGEKAILRLADELRHARLHDGTRRGDGGESTPQTLDDGPPAGEGLAVPTPRVYELRVLFQRGMNPVQLRGLLQKTADAVEVKQFKTQFVVTALDPGHERLRNHLDQLRVSYSPAENEPPPPQQAAATDAVEPTAPAAEDAAQRDAPTGAARRTANKTKRGNAKPAAGVWHVEPALFHLPRTAFIAGRAAQGWSKQAALPVDLLAETRDVVRTEDFARAATWMHALRRIPDARTGMPLRGVTMLTVDGQTAMFAGKQIHYSKSVRRTKGGAWTIVTGTIPHGIGVEIALRADATALRVDLVASRTDVGLPIPIVMVQPSAKVAPVELERPEWSTTRVRRSFDLPLQGGAALVSLRGLGSTPDDHLVLALTLRKPAAK